MSHIYKSLDELSVDLEYARSYIGQSLAALRLAQTIEGTIARRYGELPALVKDTMSGKLATIGRLLKHIHLKTAQFDVDTLLYKMFFTPGTPKAYEYSKVEVINTLLFKVTSFNKYDVAIPVGFDLLAPVDDSYAEVTLSSASKATNNGTFTVTEAGATYISLQRKSGDTIEDVPKDKMMRITVEKFAGE